MSDERIVGELLDSGPLTARQLAERGISQGGGGDEVEAGKSASQENSGAHSSVASQSKFGTHTWVASQNVNENQKGAASQSKFGTHTTNASQTGFEAQGDLAPEFLEERERRGRAWERRMREAFSRLRHPRLRILVENYYDVQKIRMALANRLILYDRFGMLTPPQSAALARTVSEFRLEEKRIAGLIRDEIKGHPLWIGWLSRVKGIGPVMAAGLVAWVDDPSRFATVSKLWAYAVGKPGERRRRGARVGYNPKLKAHCWRVGTQMLKARGEYADLYREFKDGYSKREDLKGIKKGSFRLHVHLMALRKMIKIFLQHLWVRWREAEGLPVTKPYAVDVLGHSGYIEPLENHLGRLGGWNK